MKQLEAYEVPLSKVFCSDFDFHIPDYQRPYAWGGEQVGQLLDDLIDALERGADEPYFLGSVVLVKDKTEPSADVIDGQQRLTTLTILLSVLRDLTDNAELRLDLGDMLVERGNLVQGLEARPRLSLRERDREFFRTHVQEYRISDLLQVKEDALATDAQRAIRDNTALLRTRLAEWTESRRLELITMLGRRTFLVVVNTPDLESAYRIFSVLNARGLDLIPADLFKSTVIGALGHGGPSDEYAKKWEDSEEELGRDDFSDVFLHVRMIFAKEAFSGSRVIATVVHSGLDRRTIPQRCAHRACAGQETTTPVDPVHTLRRRAQTPPGWHRKGPGVLSSQPIVLRRATDTAVATIAALRYRCVRPRRAESPRRTGSPARPSRTRRRRTRPWPACPGPQRTAGLLGWSAVAGPSPDPTRSGSRRSPSGAVVSVDVRCRCRLGTPRWQRDRPQEPRRHPRPIQDRRRRRQRPQRPREPC